MVQVIQHKRRIGAGAPGGPLTLAAGELAVNSNGVSLHVGVDAAGSVAALVSDTRQLEIHAASPAQAIDPAAGPKTFPIAKLKVPGGNVGEVLSMSAVDGTLVYTPVVSATQLFVGSLNAATGIITAAGTPAGVGPGLPAAALGNSGWYVICDVAGSTVPANVPAGAYTQGDWVLSSGTVWTHLDFGGTSVTTASDVGTVAPLTGPNVQVELETLQTNKVGKAGGLAEGVMTGFLQLPATPPAAATHATNKAYVDLRIVGPGTSTVDNVATFADATGKVAQDSGVLITDLLQAADVADFVAGPAAGTSVDDRIATWDGVTGRLIQDSGTLIADLASQADIADFVEGPTPATSTNNHVAIFNGATGRLIADGGIPLASLATDAELAAVVAAQVVIDGNQDTAILNKITKPAAVAAIGNIATYADVGGLAAMDGGQTIAQLDAKILARGDVFSTAPVVVDRIAVFSTVGGKMIVDGGFSIADLKTYVDTEISLIPGATPPITFGPEMIGDGSAGAPITFTGITTEAIQVGALSTTFSGDGLATAAGANSGPLVLLLVDGGVY